MSEASTSRILEMNNRFQGLHLFLVITIPLLILAHPACLRSAQLSQAKFVTSDLSFDNPVQEDGLPDNEKELKIYGPSTFLMVFLSGITFFEQSSRLFSKALSLRQRIVVLRC